MEMKGFIAIIKMYSTLAQYTLYYLSLLFLIITGTGSAFIYFYLHLKKSNTNINPGTETTIY